MGIKVKVSGVNLVLSGIDQYSKDVQQLVQKELKDWSDRTAEKAKVDVAVDTGALKNSIRAVGGNNGLTWIVKAGNNTDVKYAAFIEFGTGSFVNQSFLQEFGLVQYASQFKGAGIKEVNLPMRSFLFKNARTEFEKTFQNIKRLLQADESSRQLRGK